MHTGYGKLFIGLSTYFGRCRAFSSTAIYSNARNITLRFPRSRSLLRSIYSASSFFLLLHCCMILFLPSCSFFLLHYSCFFALSYLSLHLSIPFSLASSLSLRRFVSCCPTFPPSPHLSRFFSLDFLCRFFLSPSFLSLFFYSAFRLLPSSLSGLKRLLSITVSSLLEEYSADYCVSVSEPSPTRLCVICNRPDHDRCDAGSRFVPVEVADPYFWNSHHLACSRISGNIKLANCSPNHGAFVVGPDAALAESLKELAPSFLSPLREHLSPASLRPPKTLPPAHVGTATEVVKDLFFTATILPAFFRISDFKKTECIADALNDGHAAQAARLTALEDVKRLRIMVWKDRWLNNFGLFAVVEKNPPPDRLSVPPPAVDGKLVLPLYFGNSFHRRAVSKTVDDFGTL